MKYTRIQTKLKIVLIIISLLFHVKFIFAQNNEKHPQKLGIKASIETILPINKNCLMVIGGFNDFGDNYALKDCGNSFKIRSLGRFGSFFNSQSRGANHWSIVSGSLVKIDINEKYTKLKIIKRKTNYLFLTDVSFIDDQRGWLCGDNGLILFTDDRGKSWTKQNSATDIDLRQISFADSDFGWSFGRENRNGRFFSVFLVTTNGGKKWEKIEVPFAENFISANFKGREICGLTSFKSAFCYNTDKNKWESQTFDNNNASNIYFMDEKSGFIIGDKILKTKDGGKTWANKLDASNLDEIVFLDNKIGFAWGWKVVYKTIDSGETWQNISEKWYE